MFEQTFKNIDDVLWKEAGCATELDYTEQTSWILFLKYLDDLERANEQKAELSGKPYARIIYKAYRWSVWAAPKKKDGAFDHDKALTGDDLIKYVDEKLFPYLKGFDQAGGLPDRPVVARIRHAAQHSTAQGTVVVRHPDGVRQQPARHPGDGKRHARRARVRRSVRGVEAVAE
jgi:hypothetical protein